VIADIDKKKEADKNLNCNLCRKKYNLTNKKPKVSEILNVNTKFLFFPDFRFFGIDQ
jgi:hypothetical protein